MIIELTLSLCIVNHPGLVFQQICALASNVVHIKVQR